MPISAIGVLVGCLLHIAMRALLCVVRVRSSTEDEDEKRDKVDEEEDEEEDDDDGLNHGEDRADSHATNIVERWSAIDSVERGGGERRTE